MLDWRAHIGEDVAAAMTPSARTRHAELLLLCARIGYSPHRPA